jgi:hypothetical protein
VYGHGRSEEKFSIESGWTYELHEEKTTEKTTAPPKPVTVLRQEVQQRSNNPPPTKPPKPAATDEIPPNRKVYITTRYKRKTEQVGSDRDWTEEKMKGELMKGWKIDPRRSVALGTWDQCGKGSRLSHERDRRSR